MKVRGGIVTFLLVLIINVIHLTYYYIRDGYISWIEIVGLPIMLTLAWWFGNQYDIARYYSEKDTLTGLYNRRFVETYYTKMQSSSTNSALLLLDVNDFKIVNDLYGHKAGDEFLKSIAQQLERSVCKKDLVARWGGDEFLIMTTSGKDELRDKIERIQQNLKDISPHDLEISVSIGIAEFPRDGNTLDDLLRVADKKMYKIKSLKGPKTFHQHQTGY